MSYIADAPISAKLGPVICLSDVETLDAQTLLARENFGMFRRQIRPNMIWGWWTQEVAWQLHRFSRLSFFHSLLMAHLDPVNPTYPMVLWGRHGAGNGTLRLVDARCLSRFMRHPFDGGSGRYPTQDISLGTVAGVLRDTGSSRDMRG